MTLPIATRGLRHVALRVRNLVRSKTFYVELFGMQPVWEPDAQNAYLSSGCDNLALHEVAADQLPPVPAPRMGAPSTQALDHIGFIVSTPEAVWAAAEMLRVRHVPILQEPRRHRDGSCSVYCADPDGNVVQILFEPSISPLSVR